MSFARPTLPQIRDRAIVDLGPAARLRRSPERAIAVAIAGASHGLHGHLDWASRQMTPLYCDDDQLVAWGTIFGVTRKQPTKATGSATFTGTNGTIVASGTTLQLSDGTRFATTASGTVAAGTVTIAIESEDYSSDGNCDAGATIRVTSPISGLNSDGVTDDDISDGTDLEEIETYRARILERLQDAPQGGSTADYKAWIKATAGVDVLEAYVYPALDGAGTVGWTFTITGNDPIPGAPALALVQTDIDAQRPVDMRSATGFLPIAQPVTYSIQLSPNTTTVQDAVKAALQDLHRREAEPGGTLLLSRINEAISTAAGESDHVLVTPAADVDASTYAHLPTYSVPSFAAIP